MKILFGTFLLATALSISAQNIDTFFKASDSFFKTYVNEGKVNYKAIKTNPSVLTSLLKKAKTIHISETDANRYKAFWINAYNLLVIKGIIDAYPINSPLDVKGFFDENTFTIGGKTVTLNTIENQLLRAKFKDPRFHFVLVCGAMGCPPLVNKVYLPETLDEQLTTQTRKAINGNFIKANGKKNHVSVSQIMEWYREDFVLDGTEIDFLNQYLEAPLSEKTKISYFQYNWNLNSY